MLRAPHDAAGALGDCPHCDEEARIPGGPTPDAADPAAFIPVGEVLDHEAVEAAVQRQAPPAREIEVPAEPSPVAAPAEAGEVVFETANEPDELAPGEGLVFAPADEPDAAPVAAKPAVRRSTGRRRKKRGSPVLAAVVLLGLLGGIGAAGWVMYDRLAPSAAAVIPATPLPADAAAPAWFLPPANADPRAVEIVAAGVPMDSPLLSVRFSGVRAAAGGDGMPEPDAGGMVDRAAETDEAEAGPQDGDDSSIGPPRDAPAGAVAVTIRPGESGRLVRVDLRERDEVKAWLDERTDLLGAKRLAFVGARDGFFAAVAAGGDVGAFRGPVGLSAATGVLGWSVEGVAGSRVLPCCREREDGALLFCVPDDADGFLIRGRELPGGERGFPYEYAVEVGR